MRIELLRGRQTALPITNVDNTTRPSTEDHPTESATSVVLEELAEVKRLLGRQDGVIAHLRKEVSTQTDLIREMQKDLPLVQADAARGDVLYDTDALAKRWLVSKRTIETEVAEGNLVPTFIRGARRFTPDAVRAYERTAAGLRRRRGARRRAAKKGSPQRQGSAAEKAA